MNILYLVTTFILLISCGEQAQKNNLKRAWDRQNAPERMGLLSSGYEVLHYSLPVKAALSKKPWSGGYWPSYQGGITYRWNHSSYNDNDRIFYPLREIDNLTENDIYELSPSEKYDIILNDKNYTFTNKERSRTKIFQRLDGIEIPRWFGLCHAWAPATLLYENPRPVRVSNQSGKIVNFGSSDIKALLTYHLHENSSITYFVSRRCNVDDVKLKKDLRSGKITEEDYRKIMDSAECRGINAGAFHIILANMIGLKDKGFIADITRGYEVWNQAIYGYNFKELNTRTENFSNDAAKGTVKEIKIENKVTYVIEIGPSWDKIESKRSHRTEKFIYTLELNKYDQIIGGSWKSENRPDFLWNREKPKFSGKYLALQKIYELATEQKPDSNDILILTNIKWNISKSIFFRKINVKGEIISPVEYLNIVAKDKNSKTLKQEIKNTKDSSSFDISIRVWSGKTDYILLQGYNSENKKIFETRQRV